MPEVYIPEDPINYCMTDGAVRSDADAVYIINKYILTRTAFMNNP